MVNDTATTPPTDRGTRNAIVIALVVLFSVLLIFGSHAVWLATTTLSTDDFVDTFAPLPEDPAVADALGTKFASAVVENNDITAKISAPLPDNLQFIAAPLAQAVEGVIAEAATRVVESDAFDAVWAQVLTTTHRAALLILQGTEAGILESEDGTLYLDLGPVVDEVDARLQARGINVLADNDIDASFEIYDNDSLGLVQTIAEIMYTIRWWAPILALLTLVAVLVIARDRRKAVVLVGIGTITAMAITLIEIRLVRNATIGDITDPVYREGAEAAWSIVVDRFVVQTIGLLVLGIIVVVVAWLFGSSERAVAIRESTSGTSGRISTGNAAIAPGLVRPLQWTAVGLGLAFLLFVPTLSGLLVIFTALVVVAAVVLLAALGSTESDEVDVTNSS